jgi:RNA polymerase sigma-70 factor (ECF subfamily)
MTGEVQERRQADRVELNGRVHFVERIDASEEQLEDADTARLVIRLQGGEGTAFESLYGRYFDRVYGYLKVTLNAREEAEDAAQQVFMHVFEHVDRYERRDKPFRAWLFTIVRNVALMRLRKEGRVDIVDPAELGRRREGAAPQDLHVLDWISDRDLMVFVERLPDAQRQVLVMRYLLGLSSAEIAAAIDANPEAVRQMQSRATRTLEKRLVSVGRRAPARGRRATMRAGVRQAPVLRHRRFALH